MASKILVDELAPQSHATDVTITTGKRIAGANTQFKVTGGSSGQVLTNDGSDGLSWGAAPPALVKRAVICQQEAQNTAAGTATSGSWQVRVLNNEIYDDIGITLSSNVFTLPAGTFYINWSCPARQVNSHMTRLYDVTNTSVVEYGTAGYDANGAYDTHDRSWGYAKVIITGATEYQIEHRVHTTVASWGFGYPSDFSVEKYTTVEIEQTA